MVSNGRLSSRMDRLDIPLARKVAGKAKKTTAVAVVVHRRERGPMNY